MKKILTVLLTALLAALLLALCSCGGSANQFKVIYVGGPGPMSPVVLIHGELDGEEMDLGVKEAFKDCTVKNIAFAEGESVTLKGTDEGRLRYDGGVIVTLENADGKSFDVTVKEESVFTAEKDGDTVYLLPPE